MSASGIKATSTSVFAEARAQWNVLRTLHTLFSESLPTTHYSGQSLLQGEALVRLNNEITRLRSEIRLNIIRLDQHQDDLEQLVGGPGIEELVQSASILLNAFETLIDDEILCEGGVDLSKAEKLPPVAHPHISNDFCC
jgi:hypothetical protein